MIRLPGAISKTLPVISPGIIITLGAKKLTLLIAGVGSIQYLSAYKATAVTIIVSSLYVK